MKISIPNDMVMKLADMLRHNKDLCSIYACEKDQVGQTIERLLADWIKDQEQSLINFALNKVRKLRSMKVENKIVESLRK